MRTRVHENPLTGTITIEADTPDQALQTASLRLGPDPVIEAEHTVTRGGVAGFFARERYQVRARAAHSYLPTASPWDAEPFDIETTPLFEPAALSAEVSVSEPDQAAAAPGPARVAVSGPAPAPVEARQDPLDATTRIELTATSSPSFGSALAAALFQENRQEAELTAAAGPVVVDPAELSARAAREDEIREAALEAARRTVAVTTTDHAEIDPGGPRPSQPAADPAVDDTPAAPEWRLRGPAEPTTPGLGRIDWGRASLVRLGLPTTFVDAAADIDVRDDLGWVNTIADAAAPLCRALPTGPAVVVGAGVERLAATLGLGFVRPGDEVIPAGSFCTTVSDKASEIDWLNAVRRDRHLHLVIGSDPWMHLLIDDPAAVSYVTDRGVVDALYVATTLGVPLGYGTVDGSRRMSRVDAVDVALTVRRLVGRR